MKVLVAEDDRGTLHLLESRLRQWGYEVVTAVNGCQAWEILQADDCPRLTLLDWMMPEMNGLEVCQRVRKLVPNPYRYLIMLTAKDGTEHIIEGLEAGADDYLAKPVDMQELKVRLSAGKRIVDLQLQLLHARDALAYQATHDSLTGLLNRSSILDCIDREFSRANRTGSSVAIALADLDHFKQVNDSFGHVVGDAVLRTVAERISTGMRKYDTIGRYGGEEFVLVLPGCGRESAHAQADRLRRLVCEAPIEHEGIRLTATMSQGVAVYDGASPTPIVEQCIRSADAALYRAKARGRNCVEMA